MGLFNKKMDPISAREKALNAEIAALESKIKKLNSQPAPVAAPPSHPHPSQPRVRSTALPHSGTVPASPPLPTPAAREPIFEEVDQNRLQAKDPPPSLEQFSEMGMKKYDLPGFFRRLKDNFRGRPAANPKLVNYLAAGSIQGLRPLRYEKRVARNRFIALAIVLLLALLAVVAMFKRNN